MRSTDTRGPGLLAASGSGAVSPGRAGEKLSSAPSGPHRDLSYRKAFPLETQGQREAGSGGEGGEGGLGSCQSRATCSRSADAEGGGGGPWGRKTLAPELGPGHVGPQDYDTGVMCSVEGQTPRRGTSPAGEGRPKELAALSSKGSSLGGR